MIFCESISSRACLSAESPVRRKLYGIFCFWGVCPGMNGKWEFDTLSSYIFAGNNRQMSDRLFKRELKSWEVSWKPAYKIGFALRTNTLPEWFALGRSLQRFLLRATEKNIAFAFLNQPCEVRDLSGLLAKDLSFTNEIPALILRLGYAKRKMPYSPRKSWRERLVP